MLQNYKKYALAIVASFFILGGTITLYMTLDSSELESISNSKKNAKKIIIDELDDIESELGIAAAGISGFYNGSEEVTDSEFRIFSEGLLENSDAITTVLVVKDDIIVNSYPNDNIEGSITIPLNQYERNHGLYEIQLDSSENSVIFVVPYEKLVGDLEIDDNFKLILNNKVTGDTLITYEMQSGSPIMSIEFSETELQNSISFEYDISLINKDKTPLDIRITYFEPSFVNERTIFEQMMVIPGIVFAVILPFMLINPIRLNESLKKANAELDEAYKQIRDMDIAKEEFSSMITHELKTPLIPILGYCELLLDKTLGELNGKQTKNINIIYENAKKLQELIQNILDVHKLDLGKMKINKQITQGRELVDECIDDFKTLTDSKRIHLGTKEPIADIEVKCDSKKITQVLNNLVSNAIKFVSEDTGQIEIGLVQEGQNSVFSVSDNGIGMTDDEQKNLFKKFYQVDSSLSRNSGGTGLGLAICKGIVEAHGGQIWVESKKDKGTTFFFTIPRSESDGNTSS